MRTLTLTPETWPIEGEFKISSGTWTESRVLVAEIRDGDFTGRGECDSDDDDPEFERLFRDALAGKTKGPDVASRLSLPYKILPLPGRVLIKDISSYLALEWIAQRIKPAIIIVMRHPCAVAYSWHRVLYKTQNLERHMQRFLD